MPFVSEQNLLNELSDVANTALATLFSRAQESRSAQPIISDGKAEELVDRLLPILSASTNELHQALARGELESSMQVYVALRSRQFDRYARDFLDARPDGLIVNLGCGLDTRRWRLATERLLDVDLPEMAEVRRELLEDEPIGCSVLDPAWVQTVADQGSGPIMFLAEGLFMYLPEPELRRLVATLADRFPGSELVAEVFHSYWLQRETREQIDRRLQNQLWFGEDVRFVSGLWESDEMERWHPAVRFSDEWSFVDENEPKLGRLRKLRHFPRFRKRQWVVRYRFEA